MRSIKCQRRRRPQPASADGGSSSSRSIRRAAAGQALTAMALAAGAPSEGPGLRLVASSVRIYVMCERTRRGPWGATWRRMRISMAKSCTLPCLQLQRPRRDAQPQQEQQQERQEFVRALLEEQQQEEQGAGDEGEEGALLDGRPITGGEEAEKWELAAADAAAKDEEERRQREAVQQAAHAARRNRELREQQRRWRESKEGGSGPRGAGRSPSRRCGRRPQTPHAEDQARLCSSHPWYQFAKRAPVCVCLTERQPVAVCHGRCVRRSRRRCGSTTWWWWVARQAAARRCRCGDRQRKGRLARMPTHCLRQPLYHATVTCPEVLHACVRRGCWTYARALNALPGLPRVHLSASHASICAIPRPSRPLQVPQFFLEEAVAGGAGGPG